MKVDGENWQRSWRTGCQLLYTTLHWANSCRLSSLIYLRDLPIVPLSHNDCLRLENMKQLMIELAGSIKCIGRQQQDLLSHLQMRITVS